MVGGLQIREVLPHVKMSTFFLSIDYLALSCLVTPPETSDSLYLPPITRIQSYSRTGTRGGTRLRGLTAPFSDSHRPLL
jgi:hypothetical protein